MGRLVLIRHAQASFLAADYDQLSELGGKQARLLGEYWARRNTVFDRIFVGPRKRHGDTASIAIASCRNGEIRVSEPVEMKEFDEYDGESVMKRGVPQLIDEDPFVRALHEEFLESTDGNDRHRKFQKLFESVISKWVGGELAIPGTESWAEFCARVNRGLSKIVSGADTNEHVAIFSSGGPIAVAMQRALNLSTRDTLRTSWMSRNCSYSEFLFSAGRFTLSSFNAFPHLDDGELLTYR